MSDIILLPWFRFVLSSREILTGFISVSFPGTTRFQCLDRSYWQIKDNKEKMGSDLSKKLHQNEMVWKNIQKGCFEYSYFQEFETLPEMWKVGTNGQEHLSNENWYRQNKTISKHGLRPHFLETFLEKAKNAYLIKNHAFIYSYVINLTVFVEGKKINNTRNVFDEFSVVWFLTCDFCPPEIFSLFFEIFWCISPFPWVGRGGYEEVRFES